MQIHPSAHITHYSVIKFISRNFKRFAYNYSAQRNDRNICCSSAYVNNHCSSRLGNIDSRSQCRRHRLFNYIYIPRPNVSCRLYNRSLLNVRYSARHAHHYTRVTYLKFQYLCQKQAYHFLCKRKIGYNSVYKRAHRLNIGRSSSEHIKSVITYGKHFFCIRIHRYDRRLIKHYSLIFYINQHARRAKVYAYIICEHLSVSSLY